MTPDKHGSCIFLLYTWSSLVMEHTLNETLTPHTLLLVPWNTSIQLWGKSVSVSLQVLFVPRSILVERCQICLAYKKKEKRIERWKKEKNKKGKRKRRNKEKEKKKDRQKKKKEIMRREPASFTRIKDHHMWACHHCSNFKTYTLSAGDKYIQRCEGKIHQSLTHNYLHLNGALSCKILLPWFMFVCSG
jgi:hypothetical protein